MSDLAISPVYVVRGDHVPPLDEAGGKARNLALLRDAGADVPPWIVVGTSAFRQLVTDDAPDRILELDLPAAFRAEVLAALDDAGLGDALLAVRSSAVGEDGAAASFAGQFDTVLGVRGADALWDALRRVWASAFSAHALAYQSQHGGSAPRMAVIIQAMVDAEVAGVAF